MYNITDDSFKLIESSNDQDSWLVHILEEPYLGVKFKFGVMSVDVKDEGLETEEGILHFDYNVEENSEVITNITEFEQYIGQILHHILTQALDNEEYRIGSKSTDDNTKKSSSQ